MGGLHLYYKNKVCKKDIHSEAALQMACGKWEGAKPAILKREKEKDKSERGDTDRGKGRKEEEKPLYNKDFHRRPVHTFAIEEGDEDSCRGSEDCLEVDEAAAVSSGARPAISCWRCGGCGHLSSKCQEKTYCISCGLQNTLAERCQNCAGAAARGLWRQQAAFPGGAWTWGSQAPMQPPHVPYFQPMNIPPPSYPPPKNLLNETPRIRLELSPPGLSLLRTKEAVRHEHHSLREEVRKVSRAPQYAPRDWK